MNSHRVSKLLQEIKISACRSRGRFRKRKRSLLKDYMAGDDESIGVTIKAKIALVVRRVPKKHAQGGSRSKFISGGGGKVWVALTTKDTQVVVRRLFRKREKYGVEKLSVLVGRMISKYVAVLRAAAQNLGGTLP